MKKNKKKRGKRILILPMKKNEQVKERVSKINQIVRFKNRSIGMYENSS